MADCCGHDGCHDHGSDLHERVLTGISGALFVAGLVLRGWTGEEGAPLWEAAPGPAGWVLLAAAAVGGWNFVPSGLRSCLRLALDMNFLMTAAMFGAAAIGEFFEAAAIGFLFSLAEMLEGYAVGRSRSALDALMDLAPQTACVRRDGAEMRVPADEVVTGETVLVRPGERVPVDGTVTAGRSTIDESAITGESMPVEKTPGDRVYAGTINAEGYVEAVAEETAGATLFDRIIHLVEEAEAQKAPSERWVARFARVYTPLVTLGAVAVAVLPPLVLGLPYDLWFVRALTLLVVACPCALVISTPVAVVSAITGAARNGVLIKGGEVLEALGEIRAVAFDKTGTLTNGRPAVTRVAASDGLPDDEIVRLAASLEQRTRHPIADAILERANGLPLETVDDFESLSGQGIRGRIQDRVYTAGRPSLFPEALPGPVKGVVDSGDTTVVVGRDDVVIGAIAVADTLRPEAGGCILALKEEGIRFVTMLTGDNEATARQIGEDLGLDGWRAGLLPEDKVDAVEGLTAEYGNVAMVGDGVNDAPALARARVGIAMGVAGSDAALETADAALMADDLSKLPYLFQLSRAARIVIRQNVWASILIKCCLAIGAVAGLVPLVVAIIVGDIGMSLGVTGNALRLAGIRPRGVR